MSFLQLQKDSFQQVPCLAFDDRRCFNNQNDNLGPRTGKVDEDSPKQLGACHLKSPVPPGLDSRRRNLQPGPFNLVTGCVVSGTEPISRLTKIVDLVKVEVEHPRRSKEK